MENTNRFLHNLRAPIALQDSIVKMMELLKSLLTQQNAQKDCIAH
jgi:hypothetical protein